MRYLLKTSRNTGGDIRVKVRPLSLAPDWARPWRKRGPGYVEAAQVFNTRAEAEKAYRAELFAAEFSARPAEELRKVLKGDLERLEAFGLSISGIVRLCAVDRNTLLSYAYGKRNPNPRTVARVQVLADLCENAGNYVRGLLPEGAGCGNAAMSRGGNRSLYTYSPKWAARDKSREMYREP